MKVIDTYEYVSMLRELLRDGKTVSLPVAGSSMSPFLADRRDSVSLRTPGRPLRRGDMVLYQRDDGRFILHRIIRVRAAPDGSRCYEIAGDAQTVLERVREDQVFGLVYEVKRKGKTLRPGELLWELFARVWTRVLPWRRALRRMYGALRRRL